MKFQEGNPGGPGRPKREREEKYLQKLSSSVSLTDWSQIIDKAVTDAKRGNPVARKWLSDYLIGVPVQRTELTGADGGAIPVEIYKNAVKQVYGRE